MKKIKLLLLLILVSNYAIAQNKAKSYIGLSTGYSIPFGNLSKTDYNNTKSGFSGPGYSIALEGAYYLHHMIGIGGLISYTNFSVAKGSVTNLGQGYIDDFGVANATVTITNSTTSTNYFVGPYFSIPLNKVTVDFRALGGLTHGSTPEIKVILEDGDPFYQRKSSGNGFGISFGAGARIPVYKKLGIAVRIDYVNAKPSIIVHNENRINNAGRYLDKYDAPMSYLNGSLGLTYQFGK
jgi:hypothetical protein